MDSELVVISKRVSHWSPDYIIPESLEIRNKLEFAGE